MSITDYGRFVKFEHTIFALPFVLATIAIYSLEEEIELFNVILIIFVLVAARSTAFGLNRIIDRDIDARNLRTRDRELITGKISLRNAKNFIILNALLFLIISASFNYITMACAPILLFFFILYPFLKRFTWLCHFVLGFIIGVSPIATWLALAGRVSLSSYLLSLGVMAWIAGFDILYSLLDIEFDKKEKLYSFPVCFGVKNSLLISGILHIFTLIFLFFSFSGPFYLTGMGVMTIILVYEHLIVRPDDLSKVNMAFFNVNGVASIIFFVFTFLEVLSRSNFKL
ncbi:MAG: UbiA-like polyprenyltransferase [Thermodesulfobacteriota bacterium]|nr:UbiA-like polyprenyltransferase [Thermodesulfobacteriota bacterium]